MMMISGCRSSSEESAGSLLKLIEDVFHPGAGEVVLVMVDQPHSNLVDNDSWKSRREMAVDWHAAFQKLGSQRDFKVLPLLSYPATGNHNAQLPEIGEMAGDEVRLEDIFQGVNIVVAMTEFSATAPLVEYSDKLPSFRAASMPMVHAGMMGTALAADYQELAHKCNLLLEALDQAVGAELVFSTGDELYIDLRNRHAKIDDGQLPANKDGSRVINLPSGEVYIAPYEGELPGQISLSAGMMPVIFEGAQLDIQIEENHFVEVRGDNPTAVKALQDWLDADSARRNLAELGLGCNDRAVVTGNVLEDEKVLGVHLAAGRSDHIGGVITAADFSNPKNVVHHDIVFPFGSDLFIESLVLVYRDGGTGELISDGAYSIFSP